MLNAKKIALVVVIAVSSTVVDAGTLGPVCIPGSVTIPCNSSAWDFAAQALYLKPSFSGVGYYGSTTVNGVQTFQQINYNWGWGYKLEGSYHFSTGNDIDLNWYHYSRTSSTALPNDLVNRYSQIINNNVAASIQPKWDAVNLELGQLINVGDFERFRVHGGIQYARIVSLGTYTGEGATTVVDSVTTVDERSFIINNSMTYNGFGPRVGADLYYYWNNAISMYGKTAVALLVGTSSFNRNVNNTVFTTVSTYGSQTLVVPEMEAKLGATYSCTLSQGDLTLDVGWMWANYFDAQHEGLATSLANVSDFGIQGLYFGLKWIGKVF